MENKQGNEKKLNILIIDDSNSQRLLLQTYLKNFNIFKLRVAQGSGKTMDKNSIL